IGMGEVKSMKKIYVISHASLDLLSVLRLYDKHKSECEVTIFISGTEENLRFLRDLKLQKATLRFLDFKSRQNKNKRRLWAYVQQLFAEKKYLDSLVTEIR